MDKIENNTTDMAADAASEEPTKTLDLEQVDGAEAASVAETPDAEAEDNPPPSEPKRKRAKIVVGVVAAAVVVVLIGAGVAVVLNQPTEAAPAIKTPSQTAPVTTASEKSDAQSEVKVTIIAEGAGDTATKAKVSVADADGKTVVKETEVVANTETSLGDLAKGDYVLTVSVAPVLEDGSTYTLPTEPTKFNVDGHGKVVKVESALSKHAKEDMSAEELEAAAAELEAVGNTAAAANVADAAQNAAPSQGNTGGSNAPSNNGGSSGGNSGGNSGGSTPAHQHNWVAQTSQQWVPNVVWVVDNAAWDEVVITGSVVQSSCGLTFNSVEEWFEHQTRTHSCSYSVVEQRSTIHHEATGHNEDQGYYETVTTGQVCSGCGAVGRVPNCGVSGVVAEELPAPCLRAS